MKIKILQDKKTIWNFIFLTTCKLLLIFCRMTAYCFLRGKYYSVFGVSGWTSAWGSGGTVGLTFKVNLGICRRILWLSSWGVIHIWFPVNIQKYIHFNIIKEQWIFLPKNRYCIQIKLKISGRNSPHGNFILKSYH